MNKIDLALPHIEKVVEATADLLGVLPEDVFRVSAKTGEGVKELLEAVIKLVPPPKVGHNAAGHGAAGGAQENISKGADLRLDVRRS